MKKHTEKLPIDELFARKLGNASLTPGPDSFARLQARMGQHKPEPRMVLWRNPEAQRYMAAAACLLLVCLVGWQFWPSDGAVGQKGDQLVTNQPVKGIQEKAIRQKTAKLKSEQSSDETSEEELRSEATDNQVAVADGTDKIGGSHHSKAIHNIGKQTLTPQDQLLSVAQKLDLRKPAGNKLERDELSPVFVEHATQSAPEQVADAKPEAKPSPMTERVLVVTIAEPEALVAARQAAKAAIEEKTVLAQNEKAAKEAKTDGLWQKVKRIKEGDVFARQDNTGNDESGLLGRAYSGLKHSLEKDKSSKQ